MFLSLFSVVSFRKWTLNLSSHHFGERGIQTDTVLKFVGKWERKVDDYRVGILEEQNGQASKEEQWQNSPCQRIWVLKADNTLQARLSCVTWRWNVLGVVRLKLTAPCCILLAYSATVKAESICSSESQLNLNRLHGVISEKPLWEPRILYIRQAGSGFVQRCEGCFKYEGNVIRFCSLYCSCQQCALLAPCS